jgi:hypothetical protein
MKRFKFTLRDLFWLVLVCALAVGWWIEHRDLAQRRQQIDGLRRNEQHLMNLTTALQAELHKTASEDYFFSRDAKTGEIRIEKLP